MILLVYPRLPAVVVQHVGLDGTPDAWTTKQKWLAFALPFSTLLPLGLLGLGAVIGKFPPESFHLTNKQAQAYWTSEAQWPKVGPIMADLMGWFSCWFALILAAIFCATATPISGVPGWSVLAATVITVGLLCLWLTRATSRRFALPKDG